MYPTSMIKLRRAVTGMIAASIMLTTFVVPPPAATADDGPLAADEMNRSVTEGWGSADKGGAYTAFPEKSGSVSNGTAMLVSQEPGQSAAMMLESVEARDLVSRVDIVVPDLPSAGSKVYISSLARGDVENSYAARIVVDSIGKTELVLGRSRGVDKAGPGLAEMTFVTVPGPQLKEGEAVSLEFSVVGTDTVELGAKAWISQSQEPGTWMAFAQDTDSDRIVSVGSTGVSVYSPLESDVTPVEFDNLLIGAATMSGPELDQPSLEAVTAPDLVGESQDELPQTLSNDISALSGSDIDTAEAVVPLGGTQNTSGVVSSSEVKPMASTSVESTVLAKDAMSRTVKTGWGSATTGGAYTAFPATAGAVVNGTASLVSPSPGETASMTLGKVKAQDVESRIDVSLPSLPTNGSRVYINHFVRGEAHAAYIVMMMVESDGKSQLILERKKGGDETKFMTVAGPTLKAGEAISLKLSAVGAKSVELGAKAWKTGTTEPTKWMVTATDTSANRIVAAGPVGVAVYASKSGTVTPVDFDNLATTTVAVQPTPSPKPSQTPSATASPSPTATVPAAGGTVVTPNYSGRRMQSGSAQLNSLSYPVPASAIYVATNGSDSNPGTKDRPFKTISAATKAANANGTVVVRGGVYHESVLVYPHAGLTVQAYPKETVWLDGSEQVTGWTKSGSVWVKSNWTTFFDHSPTYTKGAPDNTEEFWQWLNPSYPMAAHPDQIWVDNIPLRQVTSRSAVTSGTFFVDQSAKQLVLGTDPTNKRVEVSTLAEAMSIRSTNGVVRGIGVRRYATSVPMMGSVTVTYNGVTLENMMIVDNATTGLFVTGKNVTLKNVTLRNNGLLGMGANNADNLKVESLLSEKNNSQRFNCAPVSGAMKITRTRQISVKSSAFINNYGQGPWFDESVYDTTFTDNDVVNNTCHGVVFELSDTVKAVNNLIVNNEQKGMLVHSTGNVEVWNNTFVGNDVSLEVVQDWRRGSDLSVPGHDKRQPLPDPTMPWITRNVTVANNVFSQSVGEAVLRVNDWSKEFKSSDMLTKSDGNLFHTTSSSLPIATWYPDGKKWTVYRTFDAYQMATARDQNSLAVVGSSPLTAQFGLTSGYRSRTSKALPITATIANTSSSLKKGDKILGAVIP